MARIFTHGFELANVHWPFDYASAGSSGVWGTPRSGSYAYGIQGAGSGANTQRWGYIDQLHPSAPQPSELYFRFAFASGSATQNVLGLGSNANNDIILIHATMNGAITMYVNGVARLATSGFSYTANTWALVEFYAKLADVDGEVRLRVNGIDCGTWTGDTNPGAGTYWRPIHLGRWYAYNTGYTYYDDMAINDTTGTEDNSWCGDGRIVCLRPNADGDSVSWTPNTGANYAAVDEGPVDSDTTYVYTDVVNNVDWYGLPDISLATGQEIKRVWTQLWARKNDGGSPDNVQVGLRTGAVDTWGSDNVLGLTYNQFYGPQYTLNPEDSQAWEQGDINALQVGIKAT